MTILEDKMTLSYTCGGRDKVIINPSEETLQTVLANCFKVMLVIEDARNQERVIFRAIDGSWHEVSSKVIKYNTKRVA